jgi:single-strand DNA-binding protein
MADRHVTITGNLTDDPDLRFTPNGNPVANFRLAMTARIKDGEGWRDGDTSYFRINAWRQLAEHVAESLAKGDRAVVIGRLNSRSWETPEGTSARWSRSRPTRSPPPCAGPSPSPSVPPTAARARATSTTSPTSEVLAAVRPGRSSPVPASRTTGSEDHLMRPSPYPTHQHPELALHCWAVSGSPAAPPAAGS